MAWRIHDSVIRGEIDNRERGFVRGAIWLEGVEEPVRLELQGNAAPDLAGCLLTFENPGKRIPMRKDARLDPVQRGSTGDLTASRKVRVLEIPAREAYARKKQNLPVPEHMANSIYLEWYSDSNGRVVIESTDFAVAITPPAWRLTAGEEVDRRERSAKGFLSFLDTFSQALETRKHNPPEEKEWDEFDYEKFMQECDARTDKYSELLDKYRDDPDRDEIIAQEMGWDKALGREPDPADAAMELERPEAGADSGIDPREEEEGIFDAIDEATEMEPDPETEGTDWIRTEDGFVAHPLALRALNGASELWDELQKLHLDHADDEDLAGLLGEYQTTAAKLGGALDGLAYGRELREGAFIVACLKRALNHLHAAQAALERVAIKHLLPEPLSRSLRTEFFALREEILELMQEFRSQH